MEGILVAKRGKRGVEVVNQEEKETKRFWRKNRGEWWQTDLHFARRYIVKTTKLPMSLELGIIGGLWQNLEPRPVLAVWHPEVLVMNSGNNCQKRVAPERENSLRELDPTSCPWLRSYSAPITSAQQCNIQSTTLVPTIIFSTLQISTVTLFTPEFSEATKLLWTLAVIAHIAHLSRIRASE